LQIPNWVHFVGIGGAGMSAIAQILLDLGYKVSGSDLKSSEVTKRLGKNGAIIFKNHCKSNVLDGVNLIVISSAIPSENEEVKEAEKRGIPVIIRAEMLGKLMKRQKGIAVAGAHGKTTTTSMISLLLQKNNMDPTLVVGGEINDIGSNARFGVGEYLVAEADESDGSFLLLEPYIAVVTNVEDDHLEHYGSIKKIQEAFIEFISKIPPDGKAVLCNDDVFLNEIYKNINRNIVLFGIDNNADYCAKNINFLNGESFSDIFYKGKKLGTLRLSVPGKHNIYNALASLAVGYELGLKFSEMDEILYSFKGVKRRFQFLGEKNGIKIIDDYAHHPTEVKATIEAAKSSYNNRIIVIFQPHRYSRTKQLYKEFGEALINADQVIVTPIYSAGEKKINGVSAEKIVSSAREIAPDKPVLYLQDTNTIMNHLKKIICQGDMIITMGAGDIWKIGDELLQNIGA
jgi:UDP-N-acetylmuramate--alanine ligase